MIRFTSLLATAGMFVLTGFVSVHAATNEPASGQAADFTEHDFYFADGATLPDIHIRYAPWARCGVTRLPSPAT